MYVPAEPELLSGCPYVIDMISEKKKKKKKTKKEKRRKHVGGTEAELNDGEVTHSGAIPTVQDLSLIHI